MATYPNMPRTCQAGTFADDPCDGRTEWFVEPLGPLREGRACCGDAEHVLQAVEHITGRVMDPAVVTPVVV